MDVHQRIAAVLLGALGLGALAAIGLMAGGTLLLHGPASLAGLLDSKLGLAALLLGAGVLAWSLLACALGLLGLRGSPRGLRLLLPVALPALVAVPFGTALGAYALWARWRPVEGAAASAAQPPG